jgi:DNA-binding transcriptional ArsR family regulator
MALQTICGDNFSYRYGKFPCTESEPEFLRLAASRKTRKPTALDRQVLEMQVRICKAFANATRLQMLDLLSHGEWPVARLQRELAISKPNLSQHLAILKGAGVVATRREGRNIFCSLALPEVKTACRLIRDVLRAQLRRGRTLAI